RLSCPIRADKVKFARVPGPGCAVTGRFSEEVQRARVVCRLLHPLVEIWQAVRRTEWRDRGAVEARHEKNPVAAIQRLPRLAGEGGDTQSDREDREREFHQPLQVVSMNLTVRLAATVVRTPVEAPGPFPKASR